MTNYSIQPSQRVQYSRDKLLSLSPECMPSFSDNSTSHHPVTGPVPCSALSPALCRRLCQLGIHFRPKRRRRCRAGRRKCRQIPVWITARLSSPRIRKRDDATLFGAARSGPDLKSLVAVPVATTSDSGSTPLKIALFNAQSVGPSCKLKRTEIATFVSENDIDILFIVETWLKDHGDESARADITPCGYDSKPLSRPSRRGGGILVVYKDTLTPHLTFTTKFPFPHPSFELLQVSLTSQHNVQHFMCVYRPGPSKTNKLTESMFFNQFPDLLDHCNTCHGSICILGDFNFHVDNAADRSARKFLELLDMYGLQQHVRGPTHKFGHTLDFVIGRPGDQVHRSSEVTWELESDHACVVSFFDVEVPRPVPVYRSVRNVRAINRAAFHRDIKSELESLGDCTAEQYETALRSTLDTHAPVVSRKVLPKKVSCPWFGLLGDELLVAKKERRRAEAQWKATGLTVHKDIYKKAKNFVSSLVHKAKTLFFQTSISNAKSSKELFSITNMVCGRTKSSQLPTLYPSSSLPRLFSDFFTSKIVKIRNNLASESTIPGSLGTDFQGVPFAAFTPVSEKEVLDTLKASAPKTCDLDPIPTPLLYECLDDIVPTLTKVINQSLVSGVFPDIYKKALVKPILKKPNLDHNDLKNFRPVSNLPFVSKVIEKIVLSQLSEHLVSNNLISCLQSAYRSGHSTETALLKVANDLLMSLDRGDLSVLTLLDLSAAFDTIDHSILLARLEHVFGVQSSALDWFTSYLRNRSQVVCVGSSQSESTLITCGVPQGSVLGPVLFVMYTAPLSDVISAHSVSHHFYADDTQLYSSAKPCQVDSLIQSTQDCIHEVKSWMTANKLKLNDDKSEAMIISSPRLSLSTPLPDSLQVGEATINFSGSARNLGVILDSNLTMKAQAISLIRNVNYELRRISSVRHYLSVETTKTLMSAFILSRIDYCNSLLIGCPQNLIQRIQKLQNNAARLTLRVSRADHISPHLRTLHWLPVEARIKYKIACLCFSAIHSTGPGYLSNLITIHAPSRTLRSSSDCLLLKVPRVRTTTFGERSFYFAAPHVWNSLPYHVRSSSSISAFRRSLKSYLFQLYL